MNHARKVCSVMNMSSRYLSLLTVICAGLSLVSCSYTHPDLRPRPSRKAALKPLLTIHNHSERAIVVGVDGPESRFIDIPASSHRVLHLKPGAYKYAVAAEHISPVTGDKTFKANHRYTWNFGVKQVPGVSF